MRWFGSGERPSDLRLGRIGELEFRERLGGRQKFGKNLQRNLKTRRKMPISYGYGVLPIFENIKYLTTKPKLYFSLSGKTDLVSHFF